MQLEVQGAPELASSLSSVANGLEKTAPQQALDLMLSASQARAPVRTGALRASGYVEGNIVGFGATYAFPVHWGTSRVPARRFMKDGIDATQSEWVRIYEEDIQRQLENVRGV